MTNQELNTHAIKVIGHRNPDTDSICAAIAYSRLKNKLDPENPCKPCRAGLLNRETEFVLDHFQVPAPELYTDVSPQLRDVDIRPVPGVDGEMTVRRAWANMRDQEIDTLCVVDEGRNLKGLITVKDIATANMEVPDISILAESRTSYQNVVDTLDGTVLVGDIEGRYVEGSIRIGSGSAEHMERTITKGDLVIVGNRSDSQLAAIEMDAGCIVVCSGSKVSKVICMLAAEKGCIVISTPNNTYVSGQMISQATPIRHYMVQKNLLTFNLNSSVDSVTKVMASVRFRYFPVLDDEGRYVGVVSRPGGPQRAQPGGGRHRPGRGAGDHRPPPHRLPGDGGTGVLPERAGGVHLHHHLPALPGDGGGDRGHHRGADDVRHSVGYPHVPQPHLHPRG